MAKKEKTIKEKEKDLFRSTISSGIFVSLFLTYVLLTYEKYSQSKMAVHKDMSEVISGAMSMVTKNPLYCFPVNYSVNLTFTVVLLVDLFMFVGYMYNKNRVHHDINTLKGSSTWANIEEITRKYAEFEDAVKSKFQKFIDKLTGKKDNSYKTAYNNAICSEHFYTSMNTRKHFHALNVLIIGATGSGKSRYYLKPNMLQMNTSYVVTDPKGEILEALGETLRRFGYNVRVFDIMKLSNCNTYNPLKYCRQESDIKKIAQAFIKNTDPSGGKGGGNKDPFWDDSMNAFMCACIGFLVTCPEGSDVPYAQISDITSGLVYEPCFANLCEFTRMANKPNNKETGVKPYGNSKVGDGKNNTANASELAQIFENLRTWELERQQKIDEDITLDTMQKPYCLREWENFRIAPEKTSTTILMTTAVRLDPFNIEQVRNLTSSDNIDLNSFGKGKDALFLIIPPTDKTYNFLVAFLYTQLFDILYYLGSNLVPGSKNLKMANGELVKFFSKEEVEKGVDDKVKAIKNAKYEYVKANGKQTRKIKGKKGKITSVTIDDGWYDIIDSDGELISRRPTEELAKKYVSDLKSAELENGRAPAIPCHVRFLMDEFPNIGEVPEFKEKLATMRGYEISATVICQSITQLKGMYPDDYEVIDGNCPFVIFLGGDENSNNEYLSKKIGSATVKGMNDSVDSKKINMSYNVEERQLLKAEEFGRMDYSQEVVFVYGEQPIMDDKFDYPAHRNYKYTYDYACDCGFANAVKYDRSKYELESAGVLVHKSEDAQAIPNVQPFTIDAFKNAMRTGDLATAVSRAESRMERHALETSSMAVAY